VQRRATLGFAWLCALALAGGACRASGPTATIHTARGGSATVSLEIADTPASQQRGLMYRRELPEDHGMLFVFPAETMHDFWMKNTVIPLDMIFIAADLKIAGIHADATPLSTEPVGVGKPSQFVLEVPGGWAVRHGVAAGDRVELSGIK
jgi:uncharacterized membrane protein (UPF0127 family)